MFGIRDISQHKLVDIIACSTRNNSGLERYSASPLCNPCNVLDMKDIVVSASEIV